MVVYFDDGWETVQDFTTNWTASAVSAGGTLEVIAAAKKSGNWGAHAIRAAAQNLAICYKTLGSSHTTLHLRMYVYPITITLNAGSGCDILSTFKDATSTPKTRLQFFNNGGTYQWRLIDHQSSQTGLGSVITTATWHCIEIRGVYAAGTGEGIFYLDGNATPDISLINLANASNVPDQLVCGFNLQAGGGPAANECYFDDVVSADSYIGPLAGGGSASKRLLRNAGL